MKLINSLSILFVLIFAGCGKSDKERQAERLAQRLAEQEAYQKAYKIAVMPTMDCLPAYLLKDRLLYDSADFADSMPRWTAIRQWPAGVCRRLSPISFVQNG